MPRQFSQNGPTLCTTLRPSVKVKAACEAQLREASSAKLASRRGNTSLTCQEPWLRFFSRTVSCSRHSTFSADNPISLELRLPDPVLVSETLKFSVFTPALLLQNSESCHVGTTASASKRDGDWLERRFLLVSQSQVSSPV